MDEHNTVSKDNCQTVRRPILLIASGPPGVGKTTLSRRIAIDLALPLLSRDIIKEHLFDTLGWSDRTWSRKVGVASYTLLYAMLDTLLQTGCTCIVESNFDRAYASKRLQQLVARHKYQTLQLNCRAEPAIVLERLKRRIEPAERHPGHADQHDLTMLNLAQVQGFSEPLDLDSLVIEVDTTQFDDADYEMLIQRLQAVTGK